MKAIFLLVIVGLVFISGCPKEEPVPDYFQENFSDVFEKAIATKCLINEQTYYVSSYFVFHVNDMGGRVIYSPIGEYLKPKDYPRWQLRLYPDKNNSAYNKTLEYMRDRKLPNGAEIECKEVNSLPTSFKSFIETHKMFFKDYDEPEVFEFA